MNPRLSIISALALLASGCAADPAGWDQAPTHKPLPAQVVVSTPEEIRTACGPVASACAIRAYPLGLCFIIIEAHPMADLPDHEHKHCAGYDHAAYQPTPLWNVDVNGTR